MRRHHPAGVVARAESLRIAGTSDRLLARSPMTTSLAFHIIFAVVDIGMPVSVDIAEWRWLTPRDPSHLDVAKRWANDTAILFVVGAVWGAILSCELVPRWPTRYALFARRPGVLHTSHLSRHLVARLAAAAQASFISWGWACTQYPFLPPTNVTITGLAAPRFTL